MHYPTLWGMKLPKVTVGRVVVAVGMVTVLACGSGVAGDGSSTTSTASLGQPARDGNFEFVVSKVAYAGKTVGTGYGKETAQGQWFLATVSVKNIGNEQGLLSDGDQKALNAAGQQFSADSMATIAVNGNSSLFLEQINPGNTVKGQLAFDIPKTVKITTLELHDSPFSGGVIINVTR